ncbi:MAG: DUF4097 family beta strand repeat-containing protein [Treponemataceae bacterium]
MKNSHTIIKTGAIILAVFLIAGIVIGVIQLMSLVIPISNTDYTGEVTEYSISDNVKVLHIDVNMINVEIIRSSNSAFGFKTNYKKLKHSEKEDTLFIKNDKPKFLNINLNMRAVAFIKIYVPENFVLEKLEIDIGVGKLDLSDIKTKVLDIDSGVQSVMLRNILASEETIINGGVGNLDINNCEFHSLKLDSGIGAIEFNGKLFGRNKLDFGIGSAQLRLKGSSNDYEMSIDKGLGSISIDGKKVRDGEILGNGKEKIFIDGGIGSIKINFTGQ